MTMPLPRGRKSRPTMFSNTDDFPDDCDPTTTCTCQRARPRLAMFCIAYNLWQIQRVVSNRVEDKILKLVDHAEQVFAEGSHDG